MQGLPEMQQRVDELIEKLGGYWPPLAMLASITEEVGELAREINSLEKHKPKKEENKGNEIEKIGEELGDLVFSILCVANHYNIDMSEQFNKIMMKYSERDKNRFM